MKKIFKNSDDCLSIPTLSWKENDTLVLDLCSPDCFHPLTELQSYRGSYIGLLNCLVLSTCVASHVVEMTCWHLT